MIEPEEHEDADWEISANSQDQDELEDKFFWSFEVKIENYDRIIVVASTDVYREFKKKCWNSEHQRQIQEMELKINDYSDTEL